VAFTGKEARQELADAVGEAIHEIGFALASLGAAYEQLDEATADRLEEALFAPVQRALGRAKRAQAAFAEQHDLESQLPEPRSAGPPSVRPKGHIERAVEAVDFADGALAGAQDSPAMTEFGGVELRAALSEIRELLGTVRPRARELVRTLGR